MPYRLLPHIDETTRGRDPPNSASSAGYSDPSISTLIRQKGGSIVVVVGGGVGVV